MEAVCFVQNVKLNMRIGVKECADCKVPLVPKLSAKPEKQHQIEYKELVLFYKQSEIPLIQSILDTENITYFIDGDHFNNLNPNLLDKPAILMVREDQVLEATNLLKDYELEFCSLIDYGDENIKENKNIKDVKPDYMPLKDDIEKDFRVNRNVSNKDYTATQLFNKKIFSCAWLCLVACIFIMAIYRTSLFVNYIKNILNALTPLNNTFIFVIVFSFVALFFKITFWSFKVLRKDMRTGN